MAQKKKTATNKKTPASKKKTPAARKPATTKTAAAAAPQRDPLVSFCITAVITLLIIFLLIFKDMAFFGKVMRPFLCGLVGEWGLIVLPVYLIKLLLTWYKDRKNNKVTAKWCFSVINYLSLLIIIHYFSTDNAGRTFSANMWAMGKEGIGTGFIGGYMYAAFNAFIGQAATIALFIIVMLATLPLLFDSTPLRVFRTLVNSFRTITTPVEDDDDGDELVPTAVVDNPRVGRSGAELRDPKKNPPKEKKRETYYKKKIEFPGDNVDDGVDDPAPVRNQMEINRTRKGTVSDTEADYKEIFADDGVRLPETAADTAPVVELQPKAEPVLPKPPVKKEPTTPPTKVEEPAPALQVEAAPVVEEEAVYVFPPISLLTPKDAGKEGFSPDEVQRTSETLVETLANFGVRARIINTSCGPTVTRYEIQPEAGVRVRQIANLSDDLALHLAATSIRMEAPIPGKSAVGIEIPNKNKNVVRLRELIEDHGFKNGKSKLLCCLGVDVVGNPVHLDIAKMPHLLIAGATGMGKSVCINSLIVSLLYRARPDEVKLILIDPKKVEFADYNGIPHLLVPVVTEPKKAAGSLSWAVMEMERRFSEIQEVGARNLEEYNEITAGNPEKEYIPQVVIVIDELADLMMTAPGEVESSICRLAQKARAAGMYLIIGTQRPSVDVITGLIKANVPSRIACKVASQVDSRTILDVAGAEKLMGRGDMLFNPVGVLKPIRVQGAFVEGREVISVCTYLKQAAEAKYSEDVMAIIEKEAQLCGEKPSKRQAAEADGDDGGMDPLEMDAIELAIENDTISTSLIQRRLSVGYARAARIIDKLEQRGIVGAFDAAAKKRKVLISKEAFLQMKMNSSGDGATETDKGEEE